MESSQIMFTFQRTMRSFPFVGSSLQFIQHRQNATLSVHPSILHATSPGYYITLRAYDGGFTDHCTLTSVTNGKAYKFSLHWSSVDLESSTLRDTSTMRAIGETSILLTCTCSNWPCANLIYSQRNQGVQGTCNVPFY